MRVIGDFVGNINEQDRMVRRQDANPDARANAMNVNWWEVDEAALDNGNENENENMEQQPVGRMEGRDFGQIHEHLIGLDWDHPLVQEQLDRDAEENAAAQELYGPLNLDIDYTIPGGLEDGDPRIHHVPALSVQFGDQICELALDGRHLVFHKRNDGNRTDETLELPDGFRGRKCRFFDAAGILCVMVFEADGENTVIYDFHSGQLLGGGPMPEVINWDGGDFLRKVVLLEGVGLQVVITRDGVGIHTITIGF